MKIRVCVDMCTGMRADVRVDMCVDICVGVCVGVCVSLCVHKCEGASPPPYCHTPKPPHFHCSLLLYCIDALMLRFLNAVSSCHSVHPAQPSTHTRDADKPSSLHTMLTSLSSSAQCTVNPPRRDAISSGSERNSCSSSLKRSTLRVETSLSTPGTFEL